MDSVKLSDRVKLFAGIVEKFVENNFIEKDQRDENFRKLAMAFESFVKENRLNNVVAHNVERFKAKAESILTPEPEDGALTVQVKKLTHFKGELPKAQSDLASGLDVRAQLSEPIVLNPGQRVLVPTGLAVAIPKGFEIQARPRSGWAIRDGITLLNTPGTIDADYRGEIKIILMNLGEHPVTINDQDRIAQLVLCPVYQLLWNEVSELDQTDRGAGGFGSTGRA